VKDNLGYTPFLITEQADVVKYLLDNDYASIHETNNAGQTALMFAATNGGTVCRVCRVLCASCVAI
jgi:ankyrin repeat protein